MDIETQIERRIDEALAKSGYLFSVTPKPELVTRSAYFVSSEAEYQDYKRKLVQNSGNPDYDYIFEVKPFNAFRYTPEDMDYLKSKGGVWMDRITQKYRWDDFVERFLAVARDITMQRVQKDNGAGAYIRWDIYRKVFPGEVRPSKTGSGFTTVLYPESAKTYISKKPVDGNKHRFVLKGAKKPKDVPPEVVSALTRWVADMDSYWLMGKGVRGWISTNLPPKKAISSQLYRGLHFYANNADDLDFVLKKTLGFGVMDFKRGTKVEVQPTISGGIMSWSYHPLVARSFANKQEIKVMLKARIPAKQILLDSASVDFASITGGMDFSGEAEVISVGPVEAEIAFVAFDPEVKASLEAEGYKVHPQNGVVGKMKESFKTGNQADPPGQTYETIEELIDARLAEKALPEYTYVDSDEYKNARRVANVLDRKGFYPVGTSSGSESEYLRPDQGGKEVRVSAHPDQHNPQRKVQVFAGKQKPAAAKVDFHTPPEMPDSTVGSLATKIAKKAQEPASGSAPSKPRTDGPVVRHVRPKESISETVEDAVADWLRPQGLKYFFDLVYEASSVASKFRLEESWAQDVWSVLNDMVIPDAVTLVGLGSAHLDSELTADLVRRELEEDAREREWQNMRRSKDTVIDILLEAGKVAGSIRDSGKFNWPGPGPVSSLGRDYWDSRWGNIRATLQALVDRVHKSLKEGVRMNETVEDEVSDWLASIPIKQFLDRVQTLKYILTRDFTNESWAYDTFHTISQIEADVFKWLPSTAATLMRELIALAIPEAGDDRNLTGPPHATTGSTTEGAVSIRRLVLHHLDGMSAEAHEMANIGAYRWPWKLDTDSDHRSIGLLSLQTFWGNVKASIDSLYDRTSRSLGESVDPIEALIDARLAETFNMPQRRTHLQRLNKAHPDPKRSQAAKLAHQRNQGAYANARKTTQQSAQAKAYGRKLSRMAGRFSNSTGGGQKTH